MKILVQTVALCLTFFICIPFAAAVLSGNLGSAGQPAQQEEKAGSDDKQGGKFFLSSKVKTPSKITVRKENEGKTVSVDFEEYVTCVTASEMPSTFESEALKAQSVAARTFVMAKLEKYEIKKPQAHPDAPICSTTHCQVYKTEKELEACHPEGWYSSDEGFPKIKKACEATKGELLYYDGKLVMQPLFFSSSGGQTENSEDVFVSALPYLVSVSSPYEEKATHQNEEKSFSMKEFKKKIKQTFPEKEFGKISRSSVKILSRTAGGRVEKIQVGDASLKGTEIRNALGLSSALFSISFEEGSGINASSDSNLKIVFTSSGSGHGVGMSQYGADGMAKEGYSYKEILKHYYSGTDVY